MKKFFKYFFLSIAILLFLIACIFLLIKKLDNNALEEKGFNVTAYDQSEAKLLPSLFLNGERFYLKMQIINGDTALAYCDTGGGICMIPSDVINKIQMQSKMKYGLLKGLMPIKYIPFRDLVKDKNIPPPLQLRDKILRRPISRISDPFVMIPPEDEELKFMLKNMPFDIFLGQNFFMGKAWTFDYLHRQIWVNTPIRPSDINSPGVQKLGFKKNNNQEMIFGHPSMVIEVNGLAIDVLFDSGATLVLSGEGKREFNTIENTKAASYIASSIFKKWRKEHPDWKYYKGADYRNDVIEVPIVKISGQEVGPVLFAERPDEVWSEGMINTMDKIVKGAIGGSALKYLKVTIDYNSELIKFEK